jgi:hypothetical protein
LQRCEFRINPRFRRKASLGIPVVWDWETTNRKFSLKPTATPCRSGTGVCPVLIFFGNSTMPLASHLRNHRTILTAIFFSLVLSFGMSQPSHGADLTGSWSGQWESTKSGHTGPLHARFRQTDPDHYRVLWSGRFWKVVPFMYPSTLEVTHCEDGKVFLSGSQRLLFFGTFCYEAEATDCDFTATYSTARDNGVFTLSRTGK